MGLPWGGYVVPQEASPLCTRGPQSFDPHQDGSQGSASFGEHLALDDCISLRASDAPLAPNPSPRHGLMSGGKGAKGAFSTFLTGFPGKAAFWAKTASVWQRCYSIVHYSKLPFNSFLYRNIFLSRTGWKCAVNGWPIMVQGSSGFFSLKFPRPARAALFSPLQLSQRCYQLASMKPMIFCKQQWARLCMLYFFFYISLRKKDCGILDPVRISQSCTSHGQ